MTSVPIYETENDEASTRTGMEHIFGAANQPTAILAMSDKMALAAIDWLRERGHFGASRRFGCRVRRRAGRHCFHPPLTTIAQPIAEKGRRAVETILSFDGTVRRETLDVELVVRRSTAAPRS